MNRLLIQTTTAVISTAVSFSVLADARIRTEVYDKNKVYPIFTQKGKATLVQLEDDEQLQGKSTALGMGDAQAWTIGVRGNNIIFKPKTDDKPVTNMIIVSNKRTYAFDLKMAEGKQMPTYVLRFHYPDTAKKLQAASRERQERAYQALSELGALDNPLMNNTLYYGKGNKKLSPTAMYDNGRFTFLKFNHGRDMPAIYRVEADGSETLLNTHIEGDTVVIHEVVEKLMLRLGRSVLLIENRGFQAAGSFNRTGTDDNQHLRLIKQPIKNTIQEPL